MTSLLLASFVALAIDGATAEQEMDAGKVECDAAPTVLGSASAMLQHPAPVLGPMLQGSGDANTFLELDQNPAVGTTEPLTEEGYQAVAATCCNYEMDQYMRRVIVDLGLELCHEGGLMGLLPYFTCDKGIQNYNALRSNILSGKAPVECAFVASPGHCPPSDTACYDFPDPGAHRRRHCGSSPSGAYNAMIQKPAAKRRVSASKLLAQGGLGVGDTEPLTEEGYQAVAATCCNYEMELYARRVIAALGLSLCNEGGLMGLVPWFTCQKGIQSYEALTSNILASQAPAKCAFVAYPGKCLENDDPDCHHYADPKAHRRRHCKSR